jgi:hypothetical protein
MSTAQDRTPSFRHRFSSGERLVGTFVKTPTPTRPRSSDLGFDFLVVDESTRFDRVAIDVALLAARLPTAGSSGGGATPSGWLSALDEGVSGARSPSIP